MPARKRRVIQRAIEEENDETERDLGRNDGQRDLEKLYNALEENGISHENKYGWNPDKSDSFRFTAVSYTHLTLPTIYSV